ADPCDMPGVEKLDAILREVYHPKLGVAASIDQQFAVLVQVHAPDDSIRAVAAAAEGPPARNLPAAIDSICSPGWIKRACRCEINARVELASVLLAELAAVEPRIGEDLHIP